jgi:hypothetical protein
MFFMLFVQLARRAASRAAWMAGNNSATRMPIIAITTNSSTNVNARRARENDDRIMDPPFPDSKSSACFANQPAPFGPAFNL